MSISLLHPTMSMYKHFSVVAFRNLIRHKAFSTINVAGLALSMTCSLFIFLWVQDEKGIDNFHSKGENLYSIYETVRANGQVRGRYATPFRGDKNGLYIPIADMKASVPEIASINFYATGYELPWGYPKTFQVGDKKHKVEGSRTSEDFFCMFDYPIIAGDAANALKDKSSIAISESMAALFFKSPEAAIGKSIRYEDRLDFAVTAVFADVSSRSSLQFDYLINWELQKSQQLEWSSDVILTTVQLQEGADVSQVEDKINRVLQARLDQNENEPVEVTLGLQPFGDRYLVSNFVDGKPQGGRIEYVKIFSGVAIFLLLIACINFMNLATARSVKRSKEVGVRKAIGSSRGYLIRQFLGEAFLLSFLALLLSWMLVQLLLPGFNYFSGKQITSPFTNPTYWAISGSLLVTMGLLAGSYPALYLSSLKPVRVLKGEVRMSGRSVWFRKGLAIFQFGLSISLLIATLVVSRQISYVQNTHLGYDRENLIYFRVEGELNDRYAVFKEELSRMPGIALVDRSSEAPHAMGFVVDENDGVANATGGEDAINWEGKEKNASVGFKPTSVGFDFIQIMNLDLIAGRDFSRDYATDTTAFMVNEMALKQMGMDDPLGKWISAWDKKGPIVGILKDYHTHSLHEPIKPLIVDVKEDLYFGVVLVRTLPGQTKEALASIDKVYRKVNSSYPFDYRFLDQEYKQLYQSEQVVAKLSNAFAGLAIAVSCLGLLGLVMFSAEQRTKEIGIRKVLGAEVLHIVGLLSRDFMQLILVAFLVAAPVAAYFMNQWLQDFAYKIDLSWWIFAVAGGAVLLIALLTTGIQTLKAAQQNPVESLRSE